MDTPETAKLAQDGRVWLRGALPDGEVAELRSLADGEGGPGARFGPRSALFRAIDESSLNATLRTHWPKARLSRLVSFNKSETANWQLPWHQDRVIAMDARIEDPRYQRWSCKAGIWHCEPPLEVLESMLFLRLHLDDAGPEDGAMEIALGSHLLGRVSKADAGAAASRCATEVTTARAGDVLVLSMLILHRSARSGRTKDRRVLRADYTA